MAAAPMASTQYPVDLAPGQNVEFFTNNGTPMVVTLVNESNSNDAYYAVFATIDGKQWPHSGDIAPTAQESYVNDFKGNPVTVFNTTNSAKPATLQATIVGTQ